MIHYVKREDLEVAKYNACIENSIQSRIYAFSWYLDIVADNWDVLVEDDYEAVMPVPFRRKFGVNYVYPPFWLLELGLFSLKDAIDYKAFFKVLFGKFKSIELRLNTKNNIEASESFLIEKQMQTLAMQEDYETIFNAYRKDRKKDLRKSKKINLTENWNYDPQKLVQLFRANVGKRTPYIVDKDYKVLSNLMKICIEKRVGEMLSIYNSESKLVASAFFLKHKNEVTILVSSTDFDNRKNGENTFLIDRAIYKYQKTFGIFNFGGSSMQQIAKYFLSFGAKTSQYQQVKYANLPYLLRLFKR
jgi:predicted GIY-YIG superfamily endonuclease